MPLLFNYKYFLLFKFLTISAYYFIENKRYFKVYLKKSKANLLRTIIIASAFIVFSMYQTIST